MPFTLIRGTFKPSAGIPDGDSVRFAPDDVHLMRSIPRVKMKQGATSVQLRYEGIDAVEKNAKSELAKKALQANLTFLGSSAQGADARGYILTRSGDANGRPVCFAYAGAAPATDGASIVLKTAELKKAVNYKMVKAGMAYPLFYETLFKELRDVLDLAYEQALSAKIGIIKEDRSNEWVAYSGGDDAGLAKLPPIFPKLFRRLDTWNKTTLEGFLTHIEQTENERVHTLSDDRFLGFEDVIEIGKKAKTFRLRYRPDDMVFRPK